MFAAANYGRCEKPVEISVALCYSVVKVIWEGVIMTDAERRAAAKSAVDWQGQGDEKQKSSLLGVAPF